MTTKNWDLGSGKLLNTIKSSGIATSSIRSPCGNFELLGMEDSTTIFKDLREDLTFKFIMKDKESKSLNAISISQNGKYLVSGTRNVNAVIIDLKSFRKINEIKHHTKEIVSLAISPDNKYLITSGLDGLVNIVSLPFGVLLTKITGHTDIVMTTEFSQCGNYLITGSRDGYTRRYSTHTTSFNTPSFQLINEYMRHTDWVTSVAFSKNSKYVLTGGRDHKV